MTMPLTAHGLGGLRDLISLVGSRPLPAYAPPLAPFAPAAIIFDCDLSAPFAQVVHSFTPVVWPGISHARRRMRVALNEACCAALCARLRLAAAMMAASADTPVMGFPHA